MSKGLKYTFLVHAIGEFIFGLGFLLVPATVARWLNWTVDPTMARAYGSVILGIGVGSLLGFRATDWTQVRIVVRIQNVVTAMYFLSGLYSGLFGGAPASVAWSGVAWGAVFGALFGYFGRAPRTGMVPSPQANS